MPAVRAAPGNREANRRGADAAEPRRAPGRLADPPSTEARERRSRLLLQFIQAVRDLIPPDLQRRLGEAVRELLLALRALIDWYLERTEQPARAGRPRSRTSRSL